MCLNRFLYNLQQDVIMVADTVRMSEVYSYCMDGGKDGLDQQQRQCPEIRTLSRA